ncbi:MAG: LysR family transcriptional regulator [Pseudomonadota bacterium]
MHNSDAKMQDIEWGDLRFVLSVARNLSFAAAARILQVNETTVARRIARIEKTLQARMFERATGRAIPTPAGQQVVDCAEKIESLIDQSQGRIAGRDSEAVGQVRLTAVPQLINRVLVPQLTTLSDRHPGLHLALIASHRNLSLTQREADIALRLARPSNDARMLTRKLGVIHYSVYARKERASSRLRWIGFDENMVELPHAHWINKQCERENEIPVLVLNDAQAVYEAVLSGVGKSLLPDIVAQGNSVLVRVGDAPVLSRELWMMVHPRLRHLGRVNAVIQWLEAIF